MTVSRRSRTQIYIAGHSTCTSVPLISCPLAQAPSPPTMHHLSKSSSKVARGVVGGSSATRVARRYAHKEVKFSNEGRASILAGVDVLANAVSVTLGPKGVLYIFCRVATGD